MQGFYKYDDTEQIWFYGPNSIHFPDGTSLLKENKDEYIYPVNGWTWYDTEPDGYISQDINIQTPLTQEDIINNMIK